MDYCFTIKSKGFYLELTSESSSLLAEEFAKFAEILAQDKDKVSMITNIDLSVLPPEKEPEVMGEVLASEEEASREELIEQIFENEDTFTDIIKEENIVEEEVKKKPAFPANFAKILAVKSEEKLNVVEKKTSELQKAYAQMKSLIDEKSLKNEIDYVVAAAYCITRFEGAMRFTEAGLNAKIAPFFDGDLSHDVVLDAVDKNFIRVLPDFTGVSDTIEFELTELGEEYFKNEL